MHRGVRPYQRADVVQGHRRAIQLRVIGDLAETRDAAREGNVRVDDVHGLAVHEGLVLLHQLQLLAGQDRGSAWRA